MISSIIAANALVLAFLTFKPVDTKDLIFMKVCSQGCLERCMEWDREGDSLEVHKIYCQSFCYEQCLDGLRK